MLVLGLSVIPTTGTTLISTVRSTRREDNGSRGRSHMNHMDEEQCPRCALRLAACGTAGSQLMDGFGAPCRRRNAILDADTTGKCQDSSGRRYSEFRQEGDLVARTAPLPERISPDAINEVVFEVRFQMTTIPEVLLGRLLDLPEWKQFTSRPLPASDVPAQLRALNPAFRFQATVELIDSVSAPTCFLHIGPQVLAYHRLRTYGGWNSFINEIDKVVDALFVKAENLTVLRLGLRYANALRSDTHRIRGLSSLDMVTTIAGDSLDRHTNLNFNRFPSADTVATVKIATADIVTGLLPPNTTVYVDCDAATPDGYSTKDRPVVEAWVKNAHEVLKREFFTLLTDETIRFLDSSKKP